MNRDQSRQMAEKLIRAMTAATSKKKPVPATPTDPATGGFADGPVSTSAEMRQRLAEALSRERIRARTEP
jgi:hypothetical protein